MLTVFITIDTELLPHTPDWRETGLEHDFRRDIEGRTVDGDFGIAYQIEVLNHYGLKAVFFVESLFASVAGLDLLQKIVDMIQRGGHEVQVHTHTEWLRFMPDVVRTGQHLRLFSVDEQAAWIARSLDNLRACGVTAP